MTRKTRFQPDLEINGSGIWFALADTEMGEEFLTDYLLFAPWQGNPHDGIAIDGSSMAQDIADGAIEMGLRVTVNGKRYMGSNRVAA
jgi:hypothetical protein